MTEIAAEQSEIHSIEELVSIVHLAEIRPFEFSARVTGPPVDEPSDPNISIEYSEMHTETTLVDRFRFEAITADATYVSDIAAVYELERPADVPIDIRLDFAERIGFMAVFPYVRESLTTSAARLSRRGPLLDLMRPGDLKISASEPDADADDGDS